MRVKSFLMAFWLMLLILGPSSVCLAQSGDGGTSAYSATGVDVRNDVGAQVIYAPSSGDYDYNAFSMGSPLVGHGVTAGVPVDNPDAYGRNRYENIPSTVFMKMFGAMNTADYPVYLKDRRELGLRGPGEFFKVDPVLTNGSRLVNFSPAKKVYILPMIRLEALNSSDVVVFGFLTLVKGEFANGEMSRVNAFQYASAIAGTRYRSNVIVPVYDSWDLSFHTNGYNVGGGGNAGVSFLGNSNPWATALAGIGGYAKAVNTAEGRAGVVFLMLRTGNMLSLLPLPRTPKVKTSQKADEELETAIDEDRKATEALAGCGSLSPKNAKLQVIKAKNSLRLAEIYAKRGKRAKARDCLIEAREHFRAANQNLSAVKDEVVIKQLGLEISKGMAIANWNLAEVAITNQAQADFQSNALRWARRVGMKNIPMFFH